MIISRQKLVDAMGILGTAVGNKVMQVADYLHFRHDKKNDCIFLSTTNFNTFITLRLRDQSLVGYDLDDVFLLNFSQLNSILRASTTENVELKDSGGSITVKTNGEYKLGKWANVGDFPNSNFQYAEVAKWDVPSVLSSWKKVAVAVSKDVTKLAYQGVNYDGNFVATDNRRLAVVQGGADLEKSMLLPLAFGDVLKQCRNTISVGPNEAGTTAVIVCEEIGMIACVRLLDAQFQKYRQVLDTKKPGLVVTVSKSDLMGAAGRLSTFTDAMFKVVQLSVHVGKGKATLVLDIENQGAGVESLPITSMSDKNPTDGKKAEFKYHIENLVDGASVVNSQDEVTLDFQPNGFLWIEEGTFRYLLTPIKEK